MPASEPGAAAVADDEALIRDGLRAIAETERDIEVIGQACEGDEAVRLANQLRPAPPTPPARHSWPR